MSTSKTGKAEKADKKTEEKPKSKPRKEKRLICVRKWSAFDEAAGCRGGNIRYFEHERIAHFEQLCLATGVSTVWDACRRWPGLFKFFPEAKFEKERRIALAKRAEMCTVTRLALIGRLKAVRFEHVDIILEYANEPMEKWTKEIDMGSTIAQHLKHHDCGDVDCWLLSELRADPAFTTFMQKGKEEEDESDEDEYPYYGCHMPYRACVHTPIEFFFLTYRQVQNDDDWGWEEIMCVNWEIRRLLQVLLTEMGFKTLEEAEEKHPFLIDERYLDEEDNDDDDF